MAAGEPDSLKHRAAGLKCLRPPVPTDLSRTEQKATSALYPERELRAQPHRQRARSRVRSGIDLSELEAVLTSDRRLDETTHARLLDQVHALAAYHEQAASVKDDVHG